VIHSVSPYQVTDTDFIRKTGAQDSAIPAVALTIGVGRQCRAPAVQAKSMPKIRFPRRRIRTPATKQELKRWRVVGWSSA
jgi:hypothetical protein